MELTFLVAGGERVGKSSLLRRLASVYAEEGSGSKCDHTSSGCHSLKLSGQLSSSDIVDVDIFECGSAVGGVESFVTDRRGKPVDGVILVIDCTNMDSLRSADDILLFLTEYCQHEGLMQIYLIANKADSGPTGYVVTASNLDLYARECGLAGWALTVAHHELGDLDVERGVPLRNQRTIDEIFVSMVRHRVDRGREDGAKVIATSFKINEKRNKT